MTHELNCPHCGCPLLVTQDTVRVPEMDSVELLHREIEHLRVTVARLRGARVSAGYTSGFTLGTREGSGRAG
ncbi:MAG: hypothetical protein M3460_03970 [Actinomycetota bacterium]|nr:hypothetical protein [Actinomycetota bacterium]